MDFDYTPKVQDLRARLLAFMDRHIYPNEHRFHEEVEANRKNGKRLDSDEDHRGTEAEGARRRPVEPVPPVLEARARGPHEPRIRADVRDHGSVAHGTRGLQLRGARHRQHGNARALCVRGHQARVARPLARRQDPQRVPDDRARGRVVGRDQHPVLDDARGRRVRHQRTQVVVVGRGRSALRRLHRDGQDESRRGSPRTAVDDRRAGEREGREGAASAVGVRLRRRAARPHGGRPRGRARPGRQRAARRRSWFRDRAGSSRTGAHPSLHAAHRRRRTRARADVQACARAHGLRQEDRGTGRDAREDLGRALHDRPGALPHAQRRAQDGHGRQQGREGRDRDDQGRRAAHGVPGDRLGAADPRRRRRVGRPSRSR